jgi:3-hydroxy-9,10-secoandrosta-1,3,5(10)-triene-9,17-dione monooxygenase reductase component
VAVPEASVPAEAVAVRKGAAGAEAAVDTEAAVDAETATGLASARAASLAEGGLDRRRYFDIMGAAPTAVTIVTTLDEAEADEAEADGARGRDEGRRPVGLTVSAVTSISAEPPILAVCLDVRSRTLPVLVRTGRFAVNFLRGDRAALAARFAAPIADRFAGVTWRPGGLGVPILVEDALAHAECRVEGTLAVGDHVVVLGLVVAGSPPPPGSRPLMYFRHAFSSWAGPVDDPRAAAGGDAVEPPTGRL